MRNSRCRNSRTDNTGELITQRRCQYRCPTALRLLARTALGKLQGATARICVFPFLGEGMRVSGLLHACLWHAFL